MWIFTCPGGRCSWPCVVQGSAVLASGGSPGRGRNVRDLERSRGSDKERGQWENCTWPVREKVGGKVGTREMLRMFIE